MHQVCDGDHSSCIKTVLLECQSLGQDLETLASVDTLEALKNYLEILLHSTIPKFNVSKTEGGVQLSEHDLGAASMHNKSAIFSMLHSSSMAGDCAFCESPDSQ